MTGISDEESVILNSVIMVQMSLWLCQDPETGSLLYNLLCGKPDMRLAAGHLLKSGYLTRTMKEASVIPSPDQRYETCSLEHDTYRAKYKILMLF